MLENGELYLVRNAHFFFFITLNVPTYQPMTSISLTSLNEVNCFLKRYGKGYSVLAVFQITNEPT